MFSLVLSACVLAFLTMAVHATGIAVLMRGFMRWHVLRPKGVWPVSRLLLRMIWWLIVLHVTEIAIWGAFYLWRGCMPNAEAAFYFSGITYTTLGYGDLVLGKPWRLLAPIEGLMGVLMCGLSTGYFFVILNRVHQSQPTKVTTAAAPDG
jgi:Ion channel